MTQATTASQPATDNILSVNNVEVIYTDGQAKAPYLDKLGITDDIIWVDNEPEYIIHRKRPAR